MQSLKFFNKGDLDSLLFRFLKGVDNDKLRILIIGKQTVNISNDIDKKIERMEMLPKDINQFSIIIFSLESNLTIEKEYLKLLKFKGSIFAPIDDKHISNNELYLLSIPKAGTHLLIQLLEEMGIKETSDVNPQKGYWTSPYGYKYHAPASKIFEKDEIDPIGRKSFLRSPCIFMYRHPLDIVISMLDWYKKPSHAFYDYINEFNSEASQLNALVKGTNIFKPLDQLLKEYAGWFELPNILPVSYEELVGEKGGGSSEIQEQIIWSILLRLNIDGSPKVIAEKIYKKNSPTFTFGKSGKFLKRFNNEQLKELINENKLQIISTMGYDIKNIFSNNISKNLEKIITYKNLSVDELNVPRLVQENFYNFNIIESSGKFYGVKNGFKLDNNKRLKQFFELNKGKQSVEDVKFEILFSILNTKDNEANWFNTVKIVCEGKTLNIVSICSELYVIPHKLGDLDPTKFKTKEDFINQSDLITPFNEELIYFIEKKKTFISFFKRFKGF